MNIAFFTPVSPVQSALADFGEGLALALAQRRDVSLTLFVDGTYRPDNAVVAQQLTILAHDAFPARRGDFDVTLYSLGDNGRYHGYMLDYVHRYPGVVILNDLTLHRCILTQTVGQGRPHDYLAELRYAHADLGPTIAAHLASGMGNELLLTYPLFERVVDSSRGVIVQNGYARHRILAKRPSAPITVIPYPFFLPPGFPAVDPAAERQRVRAALGLPADAFVLGSFGIFVPNKHLDLCLRAFADLARVHPQAHYLLGGAAAEAYDLAGEIAALGLSGRVHVTGWLPPAGFVHQMFALDVGIHLRHPHIGGTPYTPIRLMGLGAATIVSDIEPLAELPPGACIKIAPDDYAAALLRALLLALAAADGLRREVGENGRAFITRHHDLDDVAGRYAAWLAAVG